MHSILNFLFLAVLLSSLNLEAESLAIEKMCKLREDATLSSGVSRIQPKGSNLFLERHNEKWASTKTTTQIAYIGFRCFERYYKKDKEIRTTYWQCRLREKASMDSNVIAIIPKNTRVEVKRIDKEWAQIELQEQIYYVGWKCLPNNSLQKENLNRFSSDLTTTLQSDSEIKSTWQLTSTSLQAQASEITSSQEGLYSNYSIINQPSLSISAELENKSASRFQKIDVHIGTLNSKQTNADTIEQKNYYKFEIDFLTESNLFSSPIYYKAFGLALHSKGDILLRSDFITFQPKQKLAIGPILGVSRQTAKLHWKILWKPYWFSESKIKNNFNYEILSKWSYKFDFLHGSSFFWEIAYENRNYILLDTITQSQRNTKETLLRTGLGIQIWMPKK